MVVLLLEAPYLENGIHTSFLVCGWVDQMSHGVKRAEQWLAVLIVRGMLVVILILRLAKPSTVVVSHVKFHTCRKLP